MTVKDRMAHETQLCAQCFIEGDDVPATAKDIRVVVADQVLDIATPWLCDRHYQRRKRDVEEIWNYLAEERRRERLAR